jgi:hypothetical protein
MILTGADGQLRYGDSTCVKVRNWSLSIQRDAIEVSCLNTYDREYVAGLRSATGSATLYYDPTQTTDRDLLNTIFKDNSECSGETCLETVSFILNGCSTNRGNFEAAALLTNVSPAVDVGAATAVQVSFQISGPIDGTF